MPHVLGPHTVCCQPHNESGGLASLLACMCVRFATSYCAVGVTAAPCWQDAWLNSRPIAGRQVSPCGGAAYRGVHETCHTGRLRRTHLRHCHGLHLLCRALLACFHIACFSCPCFVCAATRPCTLWPPGSVLGRSPLLDVVRGRASLQSAMLCIVCPACCAHPPTHPSCQAPAVCRQGLRHLHVLSL